MPKTIMIPKAAVDETIAMFGELPAKQPSDYPLKEAIERIVPAINGLVKKGYNLDEICSLLAQKEIIITSSRLAKIAQRAKNVQVRFKPLLGMLFSQG